MKNTIQHHPVLYALFALLFSIHAKAQVISSPIGMDSILNIADYIKTTHGNTLLGILKQGGQGKISFEIVDLEEDQIKLKDIAMIIARSSEFQVDIKKIGRFIGRIDAGDKPGYFRIYNSKDTLVASILDIIEIKRVELKFTERFDGYVGMGYSYTHASSISRYNFTNGLVYGTVKYRLFQHSSVILTAGDTLKGIDRIDAGVGGLYGFSEKWLALQYFQYQKILSSGLKARLVSISGGGFRFVHSRALDLSALTGITFQKEHAISGEIGTLQTEIPIVLDFKLGVVVPKLELRSFAIFYTSLSIANRYRFDGRMNLDYEAIKNFTIGFQFLYNSDTKPLDATKKGTDINTAINIGYKF